MKVIDMSKVRILAFVVIFFWLVDCSFGDNLNVQTDNSSIRDDAFRKNINVSFRELNTIGSIGIPAIINKEIVQTEYDIPSVAAIGEKVYLVQLVTFNGEVRAIALTNEDASKIKWILIPPLVNADK